jgi:Tfp pilus assembly protein PilE
MAGRKLKVQASSILEVVVSMVIMVIVFGIAMMIYTNVIRFSLSAKKLKAEALLQQAMLTAEQHPEAATTTSTTVNDFRIEQEVKPYEGGAGLTIVRLTAYDQNQQQIAQLQKVIRNHE